jgi:PAS domain S-box-containing protein
MGTNLDVTAVDAASLSLEESRARLELATTAARLGIWDWDLLGNRFIYSARAKEICGFHPDQEVTYELIRAVTHPQDWPHTSAHAQRALDPGVREGCPYEHRLLRADGSERWVLAYGEATFAEVAGQLRAVR